MGRILVSCRMRLHTYFSQQCWDSLRVHLHGAQSLPVIAYRSVLRTCSDESCARTKCDSDWLRSVNVTIIASYAPVCAQVPQFYPVSDRSRQE